MSDLLKTLIELHGLGYEFEEVYLYSTYMTDTSMNVIEDSYTFEVNGKNYVFPSISKVENDIVDMLPKERNFEVTFDGGSWRYEIIEPSTIVYDIASRDDNRLTASLQLLKKLMKG